MGPPAPSARLVEAVCRPRGTGLAHAAVQVSSDRRLRGHLRSLFPAAGGVPAPGPVRWIIPAEIDRSHHGLIRFLSQVQPELRRFPTPELPDTFASSIVAALSPRDAPVRSEARPRPPPGRPRYPGSSSRPGRSPPSDRSSPPRRTGKRANPARRGTGNHATGGASPSWPTSSHDRSNSTAREAPFDVRPAMNDHDQAGCPFYPSPAGRTLFRRSWSETGRVRGRVVIYEARRHSMTFDAHPPGPRAGLSCSML